MRRIVMPALVLVTGLAVGLGTTAQAAAPPQPSRPAKPAPAAASAETFTLPTGDRVAWSPGQAKPSRIEPGKGRERVNFSSFTVGEHVYVLPSDALPKVTSGELDRRLFDLEALHRLNVTDARLAKLPPQPGPTAPATSAAEEAHTLTVTLLDRNGEVPTNFWGFIRDMDSDYEVFIDQPSLQVELPEGRYVLDTQTTVETPTGPETARIVQPLVGLDKDTTITVDGRVAQPVELTAPNPTAELADGDISFRRFNPSVGWVYGGSMWLTGHRVFTAQIGPAVPADELEVYVSAQWAQPSAEPQPWLRYLNTPYIYAVLWREPVFPTGLHRAVSESELATIDSQQFASATGSRAEYQLRSYVGDGLSFGLGVYAFDLPSTVMLHVSADPVRWESLFIEHTVPPEPSATLNVLTRKPAGPYAAGRTYREVWNNGVLGPEIPAWTRPAPDFYYGTEPWPWFARWGDTMVVGSSMLSDRSGHSNDWMWVSAENARTALYRNGELVAETSAYGYLDVLTLDPATGAFRLETSFERPLADVSTKVSSVWRFRSGHAADDRVAALPVSTIQFAPAVNERNQVAWQPTYAVPVTVQRQAGSTAGPVRTLDVDVSIDEGQTWIDTKLTRTGTNRWLASVSTPDGDHVSIRARSTDSAGNTVEQTIVRAYGLS
jgi:hypothetical protein